MFAIETANDWLEFTLAVIAVAGALAAFVRRGNKSLEKKIATVVADSTKQIQRYANGGFSLTDLHQKVDLLVQKQAEIRDDVSLLKSAVVKLEGERDGQV